MTANSFTFYNSGRLDGDTQDLWLFTCWNADHSSCGVHSVYESELRQNIHALESQGRVNRTDRGEYWDHTARAWVQFRQAA